MTVLVTPPELARTYNAQSYEDPWDAVEDYQRVLEYTGRHPQKGSSAVASALELPRGRVHPWMNGSRPAPVRAIQIAEAHDWLPLTDEGSIFQAFNRLAAWILSRGSIAVDYSPSFVCPTEAEQARLVPLFETLDVSYTLYRQDSTDRATEARLTEHRTIIGRLLAELGVPVGTRADATNLPEYLTSTPLATQQAFADTYLRNVARYWAWRDGYVIRHDDSTDESRQALATLFEQASTGAEAHQIEVNSDSLFVPAPVVEAIQVAAPDFNA